jgi:hypothetical protein
MLNAESLDPFPNMMGMKKEHVCTSAFAYATLKNGSVLIWIGTGQTVMRTMDYGNKSLA